MTPAEKGEELLDDIRCGKLTMEDGRPNLVEIITRYQDIYHGYPHYIISSKEFLKRLGELNNKNSGE